MNGKMRDIQISRTHNTFANDFGTTLRQPMVANQKITYEINMHEDSEYDVTATIAII